MAVEQLDRIAGDQAPMTSARPSSGPRIDRSDLVGWLTVLVFASVQLLIVSRIVLLLLDQRSAGALAATVLGLGAPFVEPFEWVMRSDSLHGAGATLDPSAGVALLAWTLLEVVLLWTVGATRRERR